MDFQRLGNTAEFHLNMSGVVVVPLECYHHRHFSHQPLLAVLESQIIQYLLCIVVGKILA